MEKLPQQPGFNPLGNLPAEVALEIDAIIDRMVKKVEPEIQEISRLLHSCGSDGVTVQMGVKPRHQGEKSKAEHEKGAILSPYYGNQKQ
jgi:hypothetical protein